MGVDHKIIKVFSDHTYELKNSKEFIIIHHTGPGSLTGLLRWLSSMRESRTYTRVSCHYFIAKDGEIYSIVNDEYDSWHAGLSEAVSHRYDLGRIGYKTEVVESLNSKSIGIELHGDGNEYMFNIPQMNALVWLVKMLKKKYKIDPRCILGHEDISVGRKRDPGYFFDWDWFFTEIYKDD